MQKLHQSLRPDGGDETYLGINDIFSTDTEHNSHTTWTT